MLFFHGRTAAVTYVAAVLMLPPVAATAQCVSDADLSAPPEVAPHTNFAVTVTAQNCTWTLQQSRDAGATWQNVNSGVNNGVVTVSSSGCQTAALYRLQCSSTCPGGGTYVRGPITVSWPNYAPDITLDIDPLEPLMSYPIRATLNNPQPNRPSIFVVLQVSENGGTSWSNALSTTINAAQREIGTLTTNGCATTRLHRLVYSDCEQSFFSPVVSRSWDTYVPDIALDINTLEPLMNYPIRAKLNNPRPNRPSIVVILQVSENGGASWSNVLSTTINAAEREIGTLTTSGCATTRLHRLVYNDCAQSFFSPVVSRSWDTYVPDVALDINTLEPLMSYPIRAMLNNPRPNRPSIFVVLQISENGGASWSNALSTTINATQREIGAMTTSGCAATRLHRLVYTDCGADQFSPVVERAWPAYVPEIEITVAPTGVLPPTSPYVLTARLLNPRPLRPSVVALQEISNDGGVTWSPVLSVNVTTAPTPFGSFNTTNCAQTRRHRAVYSDCNQQSVAGRLDVTWNGVSPSPGLFVPESIAPQSTYQIQASISGVPGNVGSVRYSDDGGATWVLVGSFTNSAQFTLSVGDCMTVRIHELSYVDFCNQLGSVFAVSCCQGFLPDAIVTPDFQRVARGDNATFSVAIGGLPQPDGAEFRWSRDGVPLEDGPIADGSMIVGATQPTLTIVNVQESIAGQFACTVQTLCGTVQSPAAALAVVTPADVNCDGGVDFFDIDPFLLAVFDAPGYAMQFPDCPLSSADANADGSVDFFDIDPFLTALFGG